MRCPYCKEEISMREIKEAARPAVIKARQDGLSIKAIASELGLGVATVKSYCEEAGLSDIGLKPGPKSVAA